jgi:hypothetical protein
VTTIELPVADSTTMTTIEIPVADHRSSDEIVAAVERSAGSLGLQIRLRTTLRTFPGSVPWHLVHPVERGTLEITWWPKRRRLWLKLHAGRGGAWVDQAAVAFASALRCPK